MDRNEVAEFCPPQTAMNIKFTIEMAKLANICMSSSSISLQINMKYATNKSQSNFIDERISIIQYSCDKSPTYAELESIATSLTNWKNQLPSELSTLRYDELSNWTSENFWPILLQLVYDRAVSMHYRPRSNLRPGVMAVKKEDSMNTSPEIDGASLNKERERARKAVVSAASSTFRLVEDLLRHDLLRFCPASVYVLFHPSSFICIPFITSIY